MAKYLTALHPLLDQANDFLSQAFCNVFQIDPKNVNAELFNKLAIQLFETRQTPEHWLAVTEEQFERIIQYAGPNGHTLWKIRQARNATELDKRKTNANKVQRHTGAGID